MQHEKNNKHKSPIALYTLGFVLSVILTLAAYLAVVHTIFSPTLLLATILVLAVAQLFVQLFFFLHLGDEKGPRWNLLFFISTAAVILLVVIASLWIMHHLNYNMMPHEMGEYLIQDEGIHR